ncbi:ATP-binding protein [Lyngbya sp. CCAP 1446/10]|uniref:AAA family ATPase n=1 Tax=Lyngbya sp. CCAP 1446/10 TaxID=439293 RepID=UPI002237311B|nr:ATP-binding protein [Lyngbya sp. CCAP 1446/10]MCW6051899.1 ATP-binding protein [Lyngbya sp. CCAP 1446/10]
MIGEVRIQNYKSIQKLKLELGRVTVLIGENGCGKSNILEAIALASAAASDKLDNEFLAARGVRVTEPRFMRSAFEKDNLTKDISIELKGNQEQPFSCILKNDNSPYSQWVSQTFFGKNETSLKKAANLVVQKYGGVEKLKSLLEETDSQQVFLSFKKDAESFIPIFHLNKFIIYSPENPALRTFEKEGQIQPLGINGEGLFKLINVLNADNPDKLNQIKEKLRLIDWFKDFEVPKNLAAMQTSIQIQDRYLDADLSYFDQRSSNEGFLFLLFYFTLFISELTPNFFAIDNIDASLNPRLCRRLIQELVELAKKHDKQVIFTTHNPAVLDGLNLDDDEQRLLVISRNQLGYTKAKRILKPQPLEGQEPVKLSEAFLRGYIGALPKNF